MTQAKVAVFAGTFDPITRGHEEMIRRAATLFERLIVGVAVGHHKSTMFMLDERMEMARQVLADVPNIEVAQVPALMRDFVLARGVHVMVRGVRGSSDFDYERQLAGMNRKLMPDVETIFMTPGEQHQWISSTYVREIATLGNESDVAQFVAPLVLEHIRARLVMQRHILE